MLKVHHLNNSRSQRILWLLEELGTPYEIVLLSAHARPFRFAPPELKADPSARQIAGDRRTAARPSPSPAPIVEYLIDTYGNGQLQTQSRARDEYWQYVEWIHYAEGSAMLPLLLALYTGMLGDGAAALKPRVDSEIANHLSYMENALGIATFFVGNDLTGADIQLLFVLEAAGARLDPYPNLVKYRARMQDRPAYKRGIEKGGPYHADEPLR